MKTGLWRKFEHNYTAPSAYLITVVTTNRQPLLGTLDGDLVHGIQVNPSPVGLAVIATFYDIEKQLLAKTGTHVQVVQYQLMPDHFHGILYVREPLPSNWHLGRIIGSWKGACSRAFWRISGLSQNEVALTHNQQNVITSPEQIQITSPSRSISSAPTNDVHFCGILTARDFFALPFIGCFKRRFLPHSSLCTAKVTLLRFFSYYNITNKNLY